MGPNQDSSEAFQKDMNNIPTQDLNFYKKLGDALQRYGRPKPEFLSQAQEQHDHFLRQQNRLSSETGAFFNQVRTGLKEDTRMIYTVDPNASAEAAQEKFLSGHFSTYARSGYFKLQPNQQFEVARTMRFKDFAAKPGLTLKVAGATLMSWSAQGMREKQNMQMGRKY